VRLLADRRVPVLEMWAWAEAHQLQASAWADVHPLQEPAWGEHRRQASELAGRRILQTLSLAIRRGPLPALPPAIRPSLLPALRPRLVRLRMRTSKPNTWKPSLTSRAQPTSDSRTGGRCALGCPAIDCWASLQQKGRPKPPSPRSSELIIIHLSMVSLQKFGLLS